LCTFAGKPALTDISTLWLFSEFVDTVELLMGVEETFNIEIPDEEAGKLETVGKVIDYLAQKLS